MARLPIKTGLLKLKVLFENNKTKNKSIYFFFIGFLILSFIKNRNFKIIQELLFHNKPLQAKRELAYMYLNRKINLSDLNIMNKVFSEIGWHNGAILGFGKTKYFDDITARFPTPYLYLFKKYYFNNYIIYFIEI